MTKRLFAAIDLPESPRQLLSNLDPRIRGVRWVDAEQMHLTLGFFADVPEEINLAFRAELARDNIYVTTVAPGMMRTGSHVNAKFKGKHDSEFAWFGASVGAPLISMNADRAARKILAACRRGQPSLTLTFAARAAILGNALFPNLTGYMMRVVNRFLPGAGDEGGNQLRAGSQLRRLNPTWLTRLADRATIRNNEERPEVSR